MKSIRKSKDMANFLQLKAITFANKQTILKCYRKGF